MKKQISFRWLRLEAGVIVQNDKKKELTRVFQIHRHLSEGNDLYFFFLKRLTAQRVLYTVFVVNQHQNAFNEATMNRFF